MIFFFSIDALTRYFIQGNTENKAHDKWILKNVFKKGQNIKICEFTSYFSCFSR